METQRPLVGVIIIKGGKILLAKRISKFGNGEYSTPGGHLEEGESFEECAAREVMEECGIKIKNISFVAMANITKGWSKHYVAVGFVSDWESGEPRVMEPEKSEQWNWYSMNALPEPLFLGSKLWIDALKTGKKYFGAEDNL